MARHLIFLKCSSQDTLLDEDFSKFFMVPIFVWTEVQRISPREFFTVSSSIFPPSLVISLKIPQFPGSESQLAVKVWRMSSQLPHLKRKPLRRKKNSQKKKEEDKHFSSLKVESLAFSRQDSVFGDEKKRGNP